MTDTDPANPQPADAALPQSIVLIVDDNPQNVELLQAFLESLPVRIITAADGVDALAKVRDLSPDLILLDIMMPHMSGFEVCKRLKSDPKTRDKPVNKFELLTRVKSLLRVRHLKGELERALTYLNEIEQDDEAAL